MEQEIIKIDESEIAPIHDTGSNLYLILSLLLPVIGLILFFVFKSKKHYRNARACKKGAMIGLGILAAIILIFVISLILVVV